MTKMTQFSKIAANQLPPSIYTYTSHIDKAHIMDPMYTGLLQGVFGKRCKNLIHSFSIGSQTVTKTYTFDSNGLPIKIVGVRNDGSMDGTMCNEFEVR